MAFNLKLKIVFPSSPDCDDLFFAPEKIFFSLVGYGVNAVHIFYGVWYIF